MNGIKIALAGLFTLMMVGMLLLSNGAAQAHGAAGNMASANMAQVATATPEAGMMMSTTATPDAGMMMHATTTPDAGMMMSTTATPGAGMMQHQPAGTTMNSNLPTTGSSDNSGLLLVLAASLVLLLSGVGLRRALAPKK